MSTDHAPVPRVANRYGAPKPAKTAPLRGRRWFIWAVIGLAVLVTAIFSFFTGRPEVSTKDVGFSIEGPALARVDYEVTKAPEATAQCAVQVLNESYAIVGWRTVTILPGAGAGAASVSQDGRTTVHSTQVRTESQGVSGGVNACWIVD